jgi:hypothetical protein
VAWRFATHLPSDIAENIEVYTSHIGLGFSPAVLYATVDQLAQKVEDWRPMVRRNWQRFVYGPAKLESNDAPPAHAANE